MNHRGKSQLAVAHCLNPTDPTGGVPLCYFQYPAIHRAPGCELESARSHAAWATSDCQSPVMGRMTVDTRTSNLLVNHPMQDRDAPPAAPRALSGSSQLGHY